MRDYLRHRFQIHFSEYGCTYLYLSQALTTIRMEFEALEDEANAIHGDLWEQLNAGGQVKSYAVIIPFCQVKL